MSGGQPWECELSSESSCGLGKLEGKTEIAGGGVHQKLERDRRRGVWVGARWESIYRPTLEDKHKTSEGSGEWLR